MTKTKNSDTPAIRYIVKAGYNNYAFDTIDKAASLVALLTQGTKISHDYRAPKRDDNARTYYIEQTTVVAEIEATNVIINSEPVHVVEED